MKELIVAVAASLITALLFFLAGAFDNKSQDYARAKIVEGLTNDAAFIRTIREKLNDDDSFSESVAKELRESVVDGLLPKQMVLTVNASKCPDGWVDYKAAYGRFLRGIDPTGVADIKDRPPGDQQEDSFQIHGHSLSEGVQSTDHSGPRNAPHHYASGEYGHEVSSATKIIEINAGGVPRISKETRPKNAAVFYCIKESAEG